MPLDLRGTRDLGPRRSWTLGSSDEESFRNSQLKRSAKSRNIQIFLYVLNFNGSDRRRQKTAREVESGYRRTTWCLVIGD